MLKIDIQKSDEIKGHAHKFDNFEYSDHLFISTEKKIKRSDNNSELSECVPYLPTYLLVG